MKKKRKPDRTASKKSGKNPTLFRTVCPICESMEDFHVRRSLSKKKNLYGCCNHCALLAFGEESVITQLRKTRGLVLFEHGTKEELEAILRSSDDLRFRRHKFFTGELQDEVRERSLKEHVNG